MIRLRELPEKWPIITAWSAAAEKKKCMFFEQETKMKTEMISPAIKKAMFALGIGIYKQELNMNILFSRIFLKVISVLWILFFIRCIILLTVITLHNEESTIVTYSHLFIGTTVCLLWYNLRKKEKVILALTRQLNCLGQDLGIQLRMSLFNVIVFVAVIFPHLSGLTVTFPKQDEECQKLLRIFTLGMVNGTSLNDSCKYGIPYAEMVVHCTFAYTFQTCVSAFYINACWITIKILRTHTTRMAQCAKTVCLPLIEKRIDHYESVIEVLKEFENAMSFPIFLVVCSYTLSIFNTLARFTSNFKGHSPSGVLMTGFLSLASFLAVSLISARVQEADKVARSSNEKALKRFIRSRKSERMNEVLYLYILKQEETFAFSGWGFFLLTKGFVLSTAGNILTYTLLILSLGSKT